MSLENLTKTELANKVRELSAKLKEMVQVEHQVNASVETLKEGSTAVGITQDENGAYQIVRLVFDLKKNAAAITSVEEHGTNAQAAAGYLIKITGESFYKAAGIR